MNTENSNHIEDLIIRFLSGDIDKQGIEVLQRWISESAENEKYFIDRREIWFSATNSEALAKYNKAEAFERFKENIRATRERNSSHRKNIRLRWITYAAAIALFFTMSYLSYKGGQEQLSSTFTDIVIETPPGSRTKMSLPDGTAVWLNAGSQITYSQGFGVKERNVKIKGEGYFEVTKNEKLPFCVKSEKISVTVLGTKFNFRDYPDDTDAAVVLDEGKVALNNLMKNGEQYIMVHGQSAVLNKNTGNMKIEECDSGTASQWTNGILVFDGEPLPAIAKKLERSYNVKVIIADKRLNSYCFYGDFIRQEQTLNEVLETLSATNKLKYTTDGSVIRLYKTE